MKKETKKEESAAFAFRLNAALRAIGMTNPTGQRFARKFNDNHLDKPITMQSAANWLQGKGIPSEGVTRTLADWLQVPHEWLRFGQGLNPSITQDIEAGHLAPDERLLIRDWRLMSTDARHALMALVKIFVQ